MQRFTDIRAWQRAHQLVLEVYKASAKFPADEKYGVTSQLRRASVSVASNVAEGAKKQTGAEFVRYLNIAEGSLAETEYLLLLCRDLKYLDPKSSASLMKECEEISKMLFAFRTKVGSAFRSETVNRRLSTVDSEVHRG